MPGNDYAFKFAAHFATAVASDFLRPARDDDVRLGGENRGQSQACRPGRFLAPYFNAHFARAIERDRRHGDDWASHLDCDRFIIGIIGHAVFIS